MKSEAKLRVSYEEQKIRFESNQRTKLANIDKAVEDIDLKISDLRRHRDQLIKNREKVKNESFPSFESYFEQSRSQAAKATKNSN